jgi:hypothetical protein
MLMADKTDTKSIQQQIRSSTNSAGAKCKSSFHQRQAFQASVSFHGFCNRFCAFVADLVLALHNACQRSRKTLKRNANAAAKTKIEKFISQDVVS